MNHPTRPTAARARAGFTLIEIMVVIAIIGLLLTVVAPKVFNSMREANVTGTKAKMQNLEMQITNYRRHFVKVPATLEDLLQPSDKNFGDAYVEKEEDLKDAWGNQFQYSRVNNNKYDLISLGADGVEGGEADDADIHSLTDAMVGK